jgi:3-hydroxyisobutyrate dehydrogenase-like beta-hydroxyacid dehydrogenase
MKIAILGGGMVGLSYAEALAAAGHSIIAVCDNHASAALAEFAKKNGITIHSVPGNWLDEADLVLSAVFGSGALPLARASFQHMQTGAIYADFTTADPDDMRTAAEEAKRCDLRFVDVAVIGAVNLTGSKTPLLSAGEGAQEVTTLLSACGSPIRIVGSQAGDATSLKLMRSIFTKGMEALAVECLLVAEKKNLRSEIHEVLSDIDNGSLKELMEGMVRTHIPHSLRRQKEVQEAQRQMQLNGVHSVVLPSVEALFQQTAQALDTHPYTGTTTADALAWLGDRFAH